MARKNESKEIQQSRRSALEQLKERSDLSKDQLKELSEYEKILNREVVKSKEVLMREVQEKAHQKQIQDLKDEGKLLEAWFQDKFGSMGSINNTLKATTKSLTTAIDESLNKYIGAQQSMTAHLQGSNTSLTSVLNTLQSTLSTSSVIKQEKVFDNLGSLIKSGIVYNVEQRAFLQTIKQDIDAVFDATNGSLTRLIRIQQQDLSANRLAIEYSLQKFLNQNYQTSEYIKTAFNVVSDSLMSAQVALQNSTEAIRLESAVQTQLGSMFSGGISEGTVKGLADAINALGTGDVSNIGSGMSNLLIMAAARAGMDYGQLLNQGVTGQQATTLLNSVVNYLAEMNANSSNVVKSQMGKLFGVDITDIIAAGNVGQIQGSVGSNINDLFGDYGGFITAGTKLQNQIANLKWTFGTNIATNPIQLATYEVTKLISESGIGDILFKTGEAIKSSGGGILGSVLSTIGNAGATAIQLLGIAANSAPLLPIIQSVIGSGSDILSSLNVGSTGIAGLFNALGSNTMALDNVAIRMSQAGVSGSMYIGTGSASDLLSGSMSSLNDVISSNVVTTVEGDEITWEDNVATMTSDLASILEILDTYMQSMDDRLQTISINTAGSSLTGIAYNYATSGTHLI